MAGIGGQEAMPGRALLSHETMSSARRGAGGSVWCAALKELSATTWSQTVAPSTRGRVVMPTRVSAARMRGAGKTD